MKKHFLNLNKSVFVTIFQLIITFEVGLSNILLARNLGSNSYGDYTYLLTLTSILPLFVGLGTDHVFLMNGSKYKHLRYYLFTNAFFIRLLLTFLSSFVFIAYFIYSGSFYFFKLLFILGSLISFFPNPLFLTLYRVFNLQLRPWYILVLSNFLFLLALCIIPHNYFTLSFVSILFFLQHFLTFICFLIDSQKIIRYKISFRLLLKYFNLGLLFSISQFFDFIGNRFDVFLFYHFTSNTYLGFYSAAQRITNSLIVIPSSFHIVEFSKFHILYHNNSIKELQTLFLQMREKLFEIALLINIPIIMNSKTIIFVLYGNQYSESSLILKNLSFSMIVTYLAYPYSMLAETLNKLKLRIMIRFISILVSILFFIFLFYVKKDKLIFSFIIGNIFYLFFLHIITKKNNGGFVMFKPLIAHCIKFAILSLFAFLPFLFSVENNNEIIVSIISATVFYFLYFILKLFYADKNKFILY